jgi:rubrerythrin
MRNSEHEASAGKMLETSVQIYKQIEKSYNETLRRPICRAPGFLMGFRKVEVEWEIKEEDQMGYICEDCGFVFYGAGEICACPYCGKQRIRSVTGEEREQLRLITEQQKTD